MSICPKGKHSKGRRDKRKAQTWKIALPALAECIKCGELMRAHRVCKACGSYNRKEILEVK
ncbi:MAG: 50S ribosomal protein L32 [Clostridiales bacterium]|jgi:large subunit ribosomal protein L32|nr:50S ribosomal protein L32 [Clostridiales bacterium]